jgi:hypothetical protein
MRDLVSSAQGGRHAELFWSWGTGGIRWMPAPLTPAEHSRESPFLFLT